MSTIENASTVSSIPPTHHLSTFNSNMNREYSSSNSDVSFSFAKDEKKKLTPYGKLLYDSHNDARFKAEENAGRRIGFYRILKDIGLGNFSRVKLGVHLLAKGKKKECFL